MTSDKQPINQSLEYALDRTVLANERTYAAWIRTGIGALTAGLAVEKFMVDVIPFLGIRMISTTFIAFSVLAFLLAAWRHAQFKIAKTDKSVAQIPGTVVVVVSILFAFCSILALAGLWIIKT